MVKCAAYNCRSGYKPSKADKLAIKSGKQPEYKCSIFAFPGVDRLPLRQQWISALRRTDSGWTDVYREIPKHFGICERHFSPQDFLVETCRKKRRLRKLLKPHAVPSLFVRSSVSAPMLPCVNNTHTTQDDATLLSQLWTNESPPLTTTTAPSAVKLADFGGVVDCRRRYGHLLSALPSQQQQQQQQRQRYCTAESSRGALSLPARVASLSARANLLSADCCLRDETQLRRRLSVARRRLVRQRDCVRQACEQRDAVLDQLQRRQVPRGAGGGGRQMSLDVSRAPPPTAAPAPLAHQPSTAAAPCLMKLRCLEECELSGGSDDERVGCAEERLENAADLDDAADDDGSSAVHAPTSMQHALDIIRRLRVDGLALRSRLARRGVVECRLRCRLAAAEQRRGEAELRWRRRLSLQFSEAQLNLLRCRWHKAGLLDDQSPWEWLPRADWHRPCWALADYRAAIELRAHCTARGFNFLLGVLGYPLPNMFATRSAAHCNKHPQVQALYRQLCAHKQISFERGGVGGGAGGSEGDNAVMEVQLADEYDPEVAAKSRQLQKEAEMVLLHDEVVRSSGAGGGATVAAAATEVVDGACLSDMIQWSGVVQCAGPHHPPAPSPPPRPRATRTWRPPVGTDHTDTSDDPDDTGDVEDDQHQAAAVTTQHEVCVDETVMIDGADDAAMSGHIGAWSCGDQQASVVLHEQSVDAAQSGNSLLPADARKWPHSAF